MIKKMDLLTKGAVSAILAYTTHYGISKLYDSFCVPDGFMGFVQGMLTTGSPICKAGLEAMTATQVSYGTVITMSISRFILDLAAPSPPGM